ncbi:MAG: ABC transporter ATP-binding protein [Oscillospiraceae bacterium]|nr:ABC transporter ATP-binding protein [Oscillospiraceae bacterium]
MLELVDFHYYYGNIHAVKGINIQVEEGEMVTLIGSNGAGKTTTMQAISGLLPPRGIRGDIIFNGTRLNGRRGATIAGMGISQVLEGRHVFSKLTVDENLQMGAFKRKDKKQLKTDTDGVYNLFPRLFERKTQMGGTLSGGEQQMLAIGRALISNPKILLLDEPSLGLAPLIITEIFAAIRRINSEGTTVFFVEQNSRAALNTASRGYVLQVGEVVISDKCENLLENEDVKRAYLGA